MRKIRKITIVGGGNIGSAIAEGIRRAGLAETITITRRNNHFTEEQRRKFTCRVNNKRAVANANVVILAVKPWQAKEALEGLKGALGRCLLISVVSRFTIKEIEAVVGEMPIVRATLNTAVQVCQTMTCLTYNSKGERSRRVVEKIFGALGLVLPIPEEKFPEAIVLCGSGIAAFFQFIRDFGQGGIQHGFPAEQALLFALQNARGAATLLLESGQHPEAAIDAVTTPAGYTIVLVTRMKEGSRALHEGLGAAVEKARR